MGSIFLDLATWDFGSFQIVLRSALSGILGRLLRSKMPQRNLAEWGVQWRKRVRQCGAGCGGVWYLTKNQNVCYSSCFANRCACLFMYSSIHNFIHKSIHQSTKLSMHQSINESINLISSHLISFHLILYHLIPLHLILSHLIPFHLISSHPVYLIASHRISSHLILIYLHLTSTTSTYIHLHLPTSTHIYLHLPLHLPLIYIYIYIYIYTYLHIPRYIYLHLPTHTYIHLHLPTSTYMYLHLPTYTHIYLNLRTLHLPTSTYIYLHLPTSTYIYLHLPTSTYIYLHLPTSTYIYLSSYLSIWIGLYVCICTIPIEWDGVVVFIWQLLLDTWWVICLFYPVSTFQWSVHAISKWSVHFRSFRFFFSFRRRHQYRTWVPHFAAMFFPVAVQFPQHLMPGSKPGHMVKVWTVKNPSL